MVKRFNRTLKTMLRKHASRFGNQWDRYLSSVLWAYRNVPHKSTGEKPSVLLFGWDLRTPTEATLMKPSQLTPTSAEDYQEEVILSLTSARELAIESIRKAQKRYKDLYNRKTTYMRWETGYSLSSLRRKLGQTGSCQAPGMGHTVSWLGRIWM